VAKSGLGCGTIIVIAVIILILLIILSDCSGSSGSGYRSSGGSFGGYSSGGGHNNFKEVTMGINGFGPPRRLVHLYAIIGDLLFVLCHRGQITPYDLWREIVEKTEQGPGHGGGRDVPGNPASSWRQRAIDDEDGGAAGLPTARVNLGALAPLALAAAAPPQRCTLGYGSPLHLKARRFFSDSCSTTALGHAPALGDAETEELFELMADPSLDDDALTIDMADGYLTACAIGPSPVPVHLWLEDIFAQPTLPLPHDPVRQQRLLQLLMRRYSDIQAALSVPPAETTVDTLYAPLSSSWKKATASPTT
jgi:hypothetical protein